MILIGIGANLPTEAFGTPRRACEAALRSLGSAEVRVIKRSRWYKSAPLPPSDQPWFVNGVARVETALDPRDLLALLHRIERGMGRERADVNAPRVIDLDLLAYDDVVSDAPGGPALPHPRLQERAFVLLPMAEIAPDWRHPATGRRVRDLIAALGAEQKVVALA
ncbi:MAG: 2-amino-4-hydroxy-6-hydroxymethyldihydropteridine diphosphokinase [Alphaproteobacteria bacterium]